MIKKTLLLLAALAVSVGSASAVTIAHEDTSIRLDRLIFSNVELQVGDKIFWDWDYDMLSSGVSASGVFVEGLFDGDYGVSFNSNWQQIVGSPIDFQISFKVRQAEGEDLIIGASLYMGGAAETPGAVSVVEQLCADGLISSGCVGGEGILSLFTYDPGDNFFASTSFSGNHTWVDVFKDVAISAPGAISRIEQRFKQRGSDDTGDVPEPATMLLFSTALLGLGFMRRKKS